MSDLSRNLEFIFYALKCGTVINRGGRYGITVNTDTRRSGRIPVKESHLILLKKKGYISDYDMSGFKVTCTFTK